MLFCCTLLDKCFIYLGAKGAGRGKGPTGRVLPVKGYRLVCLAMCAMALLEIVVLLFLQSPASVPVGATEDGVPLPIIMYHSIVNQSSQWGTYVISADELESDLKYIREQGYTTVTVEDLIGYVYDSKPLPERPIMLTFDDGYYNNYLYAYPLLKKYGMRAVLSIVGRYSDQFSVVKDVNPAYSHVTWDQVREMSESQVIEVQNHSYNLHTINKDRTASMKVSGETAEHYRTVLISDTIRLQAMIDRMTGKMPEAFTYPFGLVSQDSTAIIREIGFRASLSCYPGINTITKNPDNLYLLKRLLRPHGKPLSSILTRSMK